MSYNPQQPRPGGPARPLIQRPRTSQPPPPPQHPSSALGSAVAGALGGMGYAWGAQGTPHAPQQAPWGPAAPYAGAPSHPSLPQAPHLASFYGQSAAPQQGFYGAPAAPGGLYNPYPAPSSAFQQPSAYPSSFYPPQQQRQHYQQQPPAYPAAPRTTAEGYTISSSYVAPLPSAPPAAATSRAPKSKGKGPKPKAERPPPPPPASFKCCKDGCGFTGGQRQVREHEEDRHLIFAPGREPKPWAGSYKPKDGATIEGTGISLDSPEAVAKWIEDRKKRWPSNKVVAEKEAARAERIAAGLEQPPRAGRGGGRGGRGARGGRGGRGGGRGAISEPPAKRAKVASGSGSSSDSDSDSDSDSSDGDSDSEDDDGPPVAVSAKLEVPPMFEGAAPASGEGRVTKPTPAGKPTIHPSRLRPEGEVEGDGPGDGVVQDESEARKRFQVVCRHWRAGECGLGAECPYLHSIPPASATAPPPRLPPKRKRPAPPAAPHNPFARSTDPWSQLEERDWRHVVSDVLQVVDFLSRNDWLKGVERRVGEIEEEGGIEELGDVPSKEGGALLTGGKEAGIEEVENVVDERAEVEEDLVHGAEGEDLPDLDGGLDDTTRDEVEANAEVDDEFLEPPADDEEGEEDGEEDLGAGAELMAYLEDDMEVAVVQGGAEGTDDVLTVEDTGETVAV